RRPGCPPPARARAARLLGASLPAEDRRASSRHHRAQPRGGNAEGRRALGRLEHAHAAARSRAQEDDAAAGLERSGQSRCRPRDRPALAKRGGRRPPVLLDQQAHGLLGRHDVEPAAPGIATLGEQARPSARARAQRFRASKGWGSRSSRRIERVRPRRSDMWTQMLPQNSQRIWRQGPQGGVSRGESAITATASNLRMPSETALNTATLSAHIVSPYDAFSTLQPLITVPSRARRAAPTLKREKGAKARRRAARARATSARPAAAGGGGAGAFPPASRPPG